MYLHRLRLQHVKRVEDLTINFMTDEGVPRKWTVLIGENGTAKTTILQAIALAAAGRMWVNDLARPVMAGFANANARAPSMTIEARFGFTELGRQGKFHGLPDALPPKTTLYSRVNLDAGLNTLLAFDRYDQDQLGPQPESGSAALTPLEKARAHGWAHWFVAAFGVNRGLPRAGDAPDLARPAIDRLRPFFNPRISLTSIDFIDLFGPRSEKGRRYVKALNDILVGTGLLPDDIRAIELRGRSGVRKASDVPFRNQFVQSSGGREDKVPMDGAAHGMQTTLAWISDLIGHVMYETPERVEADDLEGLVLIDEIDLYLHPIWQRRLVGALRKVFPRLQFVVTTHSPVMLSAFEPDEVVRLNLDDAGHVIKLPHAADPRLLTATELLEDYFSIKDATPNLHGERLREATALANRPRRSEFEDRRLNELLDELESAGVDVGDLRTRGPAPVPHLEDLDALIAGLGGDGGIEPDAGISGAPSDPDDPYRLLDWEPEGGGS